MIAFTIKGTMNHVLNEINHKTVPDGLFEVVVDMICGEVLKVKYQAGELDVDMVNMDGIVESVQQGDTTVKFATTESGGNNIDGLFEWLINGKGCDLLCYRKMRW